MEDLNLRREFWEARGAAVLPYSDKRWFQVVLRGAVIGAGTSEPSAWRDTPPVETDEGLALRELVKFQREHGRDWTWVVGYDNEFDRYYCHIYKWSMQIATTNEPTPARAICLAVIAAVKGQHEAAE